jgi:RNA polymerase sigma-70 factor, ECF subfamily
VATRQQDFERLAMPHTRSLLRVARRLTPDLSTAEDLVQETMLSAWRGFHQFTAGTNERAWLFRILINAAHARGRKLQSAPQTVPISEHDFPVDASAPMAVEVTRALDELPLEQREVLMLGVVEGFTSQEMSEILSIPIGTVMSRMSRGRQALRAKLSPQSMGKEA